MSLTDLQNKVEQKLGSIGSTLDALMEKQKVFESNYNKIINNLKASVENQISLIKERETQCLQAIEDATFRQKNILNSQANSLMRKRDSLLETQKLLQQYKGNNIEALTKIFDENFERMEVEEDYNKDQLWKSIQDFMKSTQTPTLQPISVHSPNLPQNVWLANSKHHESASVDKCWKQAKVRKDLSIWLASTMSTATKGSETSQMNPAVSKNGFPSSACENYHHCNFNFPCTPRDGRSRRSSISSSIEIVPCPESQENSFSTTEEDYINIKKRWLSGDSSTSNKNTNADSIVIEEFACQANECCKSYDDCFLDGYCKRLANERALQTAQWLSKTQAGNQQQKAHSRDSSTNNVTSFTSNDDIRAQTLKEGREKVLRHMAQIMASGTEKWLSKNSSKEIIHQDSRIQVPLETPVLRVSPVSALLAYSPQLSVPCRKPYVTYKAPCKSWLLKRSLSGAENSIDANSQTQMSHQKVWLLSKHKESTVKKEDLPETPNSKSCFDMGDVKGALSELSVLIPQHFPPLENNAFHSLLQTCPPTGPEVLPPTPREETGKDIQRKLKWLSGDRFRVPIPGHVSLVTEPPFCPLPDSLMGLVENNLEKWLMKRL